MRVVKIKVEALADWPSNKVRHVFGPKESFRIVQTPQSPALSYTVAEESSAYASNNGCMAPDRPGLFNITISANSLCNNLTFNCIAPTGLCGGNPRTLTVDEWHALRRIPLQGGEMGVLMHIDTWLEPLYVSFAKVRLYEGECPASNLTGWFLDQDQFPASLLAHDAAAGAEYAEWQSNNPPTQALGVVHSLGDENIEGAGRFGNVVYERWEPVISRNKQIEAYRRKILLAFRPAIQRHLHALPVEMRAVFQTNVVMRASLSTQEAELIFPE